MARDQAVIGCAWWAARLAPGTIGSMPCL